MAVEWTALATLYCPRVRRASAVRFLYETCSIRMANTKILVEKTAEHSHLHSIASLAFQHAKLWGEPEAEIPPN